MFAWDHANTGHVAKHNVSREEAEQVIENNPFDLECQFRNGEQRVVHIGETNAGRILIVIATACEEMIRVVTAYPANRRLRKFYLNQKDLDNGKDLRDP